MFGLSPYVMCSVAILCFMSARTHARPLARPQRQTLTAELATGLTGAGSSFNPLYEGQMVQESYYGGYQQSEQQRTSQYDDNTPSILDGNKGGYKGTYGTKGGTKGGYGSKSGYSGNRSGYGKGYGKGYGSGYGNAKGGNKWQGFGGGRTGYGGIQQQTSQYGEKY